VKERGVGKTFVDKSFPKPFQKTMTKKCSQDSLVRRATLIVKKSSVLEVGKEFSLQEGENILGRLAEAATIVVPDKLISRTHCLLTLDNSCRVFVSDLKSGNGTFVNDGRVTDKKEMITGDCLQVGDTQMELEIPLELVSTNIMLAQKQEGLKPADSPRVQAPTRDSNVKFPKALLVKIGKVFLIFLLLIGIAKIFLRDTGSQIPKPADCTQTYTWGYYKFRHPTGWQRFDKFAKNEFALTYFDRSVLHFGTQHENKMVGFIVDTLNAVPPQVTLKQVFETDGKNFPREMNHGQSLNNIQQLELNRKKAILGKSPVFSYNDQDTQTLEACILEHGRRYLLLAYAPKELFPKFESLFQEMMASFEVGDLTEEFSKPEDVRKDSLLLVKLADPLVEKKDVKPENLFLALKKYRQAAFLLNRFDFKKEDPERDALIKKFQNAQIILDEHYRDLRFKLERGIKIKNNAVVYEAAKEILDIIPEEEDERHKAAAIYYNDLKKQFEKIGRY